MIHIKSIRLCLLQNVKGLICANNREMQKRLKHIHVCVNQHILIPVRWKQVNREYQIPHVPVEVSPLQDEKLALVVLNTPLDCKVEHLRRLWRKAAYKACVDGAINELHRRFENEAEEFVPHIITGDFDSASPELLKSYESKGSAIVHTPDQDYTDFTKCIMYMVEDFKKKQIQVDKIVAYSSPHHMERFDHLMANVNTLFEAKKTTDVPLFLMSEHASVCLLNAGQSRLHVDTGLEGEHCGLIPVGTPCESVTTTGLKWNLDNQRLEFGHLVSTSNAVLPGTKFVTVETSHPLLWTMSIKK